MVLPGKFGSLIEKLDSASKTVKEAYNKHSPAIYSKLKPGIDKVYGGLEASKEAGRKVIGLAEYFTADHPKKAWATSAILASSLTLGGVYLFSPKQSANAAPQEQTTQVQKQTLYDHLFEVDNKSENKEKAERLAEQFKDIEYNAFVAPTKNDQGKIEYQTFVSTKNILTSFQTEGEINRILAPKHLKGEVIKYEAPKSTGTANVQAYHPKVAKKAAKSKYHKIPTSKALPDARNPAPPIESLEDIARVFRKRFGIKHFKKKTTVKSLEDLAGVTNAYNALDKAYEAGNVKELAKVFGDSYCAIYDGKDIKFGTTPLTSNLKKNNSSIDWSKNNKHIRILNDLEILHLYKTDRIKCPVKPGQYGIATIIQDGRNVTWERLILFGKNKGQWKVTAH